MKDAHKEPSYPLPPIRVLHYVRDAVQGYKVTVDEHAEVKWEGISDVAVTGKRLWALPPAKMELLRQCLEKYDFLNLDRPKLDENRILGGFCGFPDFGNYTITVIFKDGTTKKIHHDMNSDDLDKKIWKLERQLETIIGVRKYAGKPSLLE